jgi:uncharacterized repeat protein (TIGR03803 family)
MRTVDRCARTFAVLGAAAFALGLASASAHTETVLHSFTGGSDGAYPEGNLTMDQAGNLYGTTQEGGGGCKVAKGCGTVLKITSGGTESVLYAFHNTTDGRWPNGGLVVDTGGNLYGTTYGGRKRNCATVFKVSPVGVETVLYTFQCGSDGAQPSAGLVADQSGNLYGTASSGGANLCECGTVFEVSSGGAFSVLYAFQGGRANDGADPQGQLTVDGAGNLYGTTVLGGSSHCGNGCGTVFKLAPDGTETVLHAFRGGQDGSAPRGTLVFDSTGNLYGTTLVGGGTGCGGTGCGTVFELAPDETETILSRFNRSGGPANPAGGVLLDTSDEAFGTTTSGGSGGCGTVFKLVRDSRITTLYSFTCGDDGSYPDAGLLMDSSGNLYGTTRSGGKSGDGTVFEVRN